MTQLGSRGRGCLPLRMLLLAWVLGGCTEPTNQAVHPTKSNLPPVGSPAIVGSSQPADLAPDAMQHWTSVRDALLARPSAILALGQLGDDSDAPDVFAIEIDVATDTSGRVFVLDVQNRTVKIFGSAGEYIGSVGRSGQGPGEFATPTALEVLPDGRLIVSDRGRIKVFQDTPTGYSHEVSHPIDFVPRKACSADGRFFAAGWSATRERIVHEVPLSGDRFSESFGDGYLSDSPLVRDQLSRGLVACLSDPLRLFFAYNQIPVVKAYSASDGSLMWEAQVEDYLQASITEYDFGRSLGFSGDPQDHAVSLTPTSQRTILFQTMRLPEKVPGALPETDDVQVRSHLIDAESGQGALISTSLPLIAEANAHTYVAMWLLPYPRIEVRKWNRQTLTGER